VVSFDLLEVEVVNKLILSLLLMLVSFVAGCDALTMTPDAWLHPPRWDEKETSKVELENSQLRAQAKSGSQP
jgi:hypothetical protein